MGNKRICWVEKIDNAKDTVEKIVLTKEAMDYYSRKMENVRKTCQSTLP